MRLGIEEFRIASEYSTDRLVYRESPFELGYYNYYRWGASPEVLVRRKVREHVTTSHLFASVEDALAMVRPDLFLDGHVEKIEEVDLDKERWSAHLVLELSIREPGDKAPLIARRYDVTRPAAGRNPLAVVKAMSEALEEAVSAFVADADKALARRKGS